MRIILWGIIMNILRKKNSEPKENPLARPLKPENAEDAAAPEPEDVPSMPPMDEAPEADASLPPFMLNSADDSEDDLPPPPFMRETPAEKSMKRAFGAESPAAFSSQVKGPVFVSLDKYREVKQMLFDLKSASREFRQIIAELKQNRDGGTALLEQSVEKLTTIEERIENIGVTLKTK